MTARFDRSLIPDIPNLHFEQTLWQSSIQSIAGIDEAGRGAWAGPVAAGVVILPADDNIRDALHGVRDSKQLSAAHRQRLELVIRETAIACAVGLASNCEIDTLGILPATRLAMTRAVELLALTPDHLLIDALFLPEVPVPQTSLVKGDQRSLSIAAASILAKTARDRWMESLAQREPRYAFEHNKGYGTRSHLLALREYGPCREHRFSYSPIRSCK